MVKLPEEDVDVPEHAVLDKLTPLVADPRDCKIHQGDCGGLVSDPEE
jgi:hypothetical protein